MDNQIADSGQGQQQGGFSIPPLPEGFTLDQQPQAAGGGIPPLPEGFTLDQLQAKTAPQLPPATELAKLDTDEKVNGWLQSIPEDQRDAARNAWADAYVANERSTPSPISDAVSRMARSVPGAGAYLDEGDAALSSALGGDYNNALAYRRAQNRAVDAADTPKVSTPLGDVYVSGLEKAAGGVAGGLAMPMARVASGTGMLADAANVGANAGLYSAAQGFGEGEGGVGNRLADAAQSGAEGTITGGALGATLNRLTRALPSTQNAAVAAATPRGQAVEAAERLRQNVGPQSLPEFVASSDDLGMGTVTGGLNSMPFGTPIRHVAQDTMRDLGNNVAAIADQYGNAGTGATVNASDAAAAADAAGQNAAGALRNWIGPVSRAAMKQDYDAAYAGIPPGAMTDLSNTRLALQQAMNRAHEAASPVGDDVFRLIGDAVTRPQGMTLDGLKQLKSEIQSLQNNKLLPEATKLKDYLKPISQALDDDLRNAFHTHGGPASLNLYDQASVNASQILRDRQTLSKIIGNERASSPNAASPQQVFDRIINMAGDKNGANIQNLMLVRDRVLKSGTPGAWNDVASAVIRRMGEGPSANPGAPGVLPEFSPDRWLTQWNKLSDAGKDALFGAKGGGLRQSLEDISTVSERFRNLRQFQNPSGSAHGFAWFELALLGWEMGPLKPLGQVAGTYALSKLLSRPATAKAVSRWGNAVYNATTGQAGQNMVKLATLNLAKEIADETGQDETQVRDRLAATVPPISANRQ